MTATLLRRPPLLAWLVLLLALLGGARPAHASHLLGGEMTYKYLNATGPAATPYRYEITLTIYTNCNSSVSAPTAASIYIYNQATGALLASPSVARTFLSPTCVTVPVPLGCTNTGATQQPFRVNRYVATVSLPAATNGYYAYFTSGNRNAGIANIASPDYEYLTLYATLARPALANSSPVFATDALAVLCAADTTVVLNNAVDIDGDRLEYSLATPYSAANYPSLFTLPLTTVTYNPTYSNIRPLGASPNSAKIDASSGISKFYATSTGAQYAVAIDVKEYRTIGGVETLIGTTRRDVQLIVGTCPPTMPPVLPTSTIMPRSYTIEAGSTLSVPITATQPDNHPLTLMASSTLLDGAGGYAATFGGSAGTPVYAGSPLGSYTVAGTTNGTVSGTFVFTPTCTDARSTPYDVTLLVNDIGCAGKLRSEVLRITVVKPTGPTAIAGNLAMCGLNTTQTYTATGGTASTISWIVTGGTIVGSATANPVTVQWGGAGVGTIAAQGSTRFGCLADAVTKNITISPAATLAVAGNLAICQGGSTSISIAGGTAPYLLTGGAGPITGAGPFVLSPSQTTTYTVAPVVGPASGCPPTGQFTITVSPAPVATAGAAVALCAGGTGQLGAAPVAGLSYSWSPATGLSSSTVANPTVTLPNTTGAPINQTYTLTVTNAGGCQASSPVVVTVAPPPVAVTGAAVAVCPGTPGQLGAAPVAGLSYSWSPATGLSSSTVANPTVTLPNTTGAPLTQTYALTVTNGAGCTGTGTVAVTVSSQPTSNAGAPATVCAGSPAQLGAAPVPGHTYSWSPTAGLSNPASANPTVTLPNATGTAITQTYTLTTTNAGGCAGTATVAVTVLPLPVAVPGTAQAICAGGSAQLGAVPLNSLTYSWSPATGLSSASVANPTVTLPNATGAPITQTYTLTVTNGAGCTSTGTVVVTVQPLPLAVAGAALTRCSGNAGPLGAAPVAGLSYSWSPATGLSSSTVANPTVTLTNATGAPLTQTYTLTATNAGGCASTATVAVTVLPALTPGSIGADQTVCAGSLPAALISLSAAGGGPGPFAYQWESSADNLTWTAIGGVTTLGCAPGPVAATTYFRRRVAASCGTAYSNVVTVTAQPLLLPAVALPVLPAQCAGTAFTFTPVPANAGTSPTYQWFVNGTAVGTGPSYISSTLRDGDLVRVVLTPTAGFCASGPAIATARVSLTPVLISSVGIAATTLLPACPGEVVAFGVDAVANIGTSPQYQWQVDGVSVAGATGPRFSSRTLRDGQTVTLLVRSTDACGQPATATSNAVRVAISQPVALSAGPDKTIMEGESVVLEGTASGSPFVVWSPTQTLTFASGDRLRPTAAPLATTTYTLAAGAGGCASTSQVTVTVLPRLRIPNAFSPNGDNNDDTWQIDNLDAYPNSRVVVFNRWGAKVFEAANYNRGSEWRGTINGQPVPFGTYYYVITLGNGKSFTGPLTVIN